MKFLLALFVSLVVASDTVAQDFLIRDIPELPQGAWEDYDLNVYQPSWNLHMKRYKAVSATNSTAEVKRLRSDGQCRNLVVSPNGQWFCFTTGNVLRIWSLLAGAEGVRIRHFGPANDFWYTAVSPDSSTLVTARGGSVFPNSEKYMKEEHCINFWATDTGELLESLPVTSLTDGIDKKDRRLRYAVNALAISPDGKKVAVWLYHSRAVGDGFVVWIDRSSHRIIQKSYLPKDERKGLLHMNRGGVTERPMAFVNNDKVMLLGERSYKDEASSVVYVVSSDGSAEKLCGLPRSQFPEDELEHGGGSDEVVYSSLSFCKSREIYAVSGSTGSKGSLAGELRCRVIVRKLADNSEVRTFRLPGGPPSSMEFSEDGSKIMVDVGGGWGGTRGRAGHRSIQLDLDTGKIHRTFLGKQIQFVPGTRFQVHLSDREVFLSSAESAKFVASFVPLPCENDWATLAADGSVDCSDLSTALLERRQPKVVPLILAGVPPNIASSAPESYAVPAVRLRVIEENEDFAQVRVEFSISGKGVSFSNGSLERIGGAALRFDNPKSAGPAASEPQNPHGNSGQAKGVGVRKVDRIRGERIFHVDMKVPFPNGKSRMSLRARVKDSMGSETVCSPLVVERTKLTRLLPNRLVSLSIGIANHKFEEFNTLEYAAADALSVQEALAKQEGKVFGEVLQQTYVDQEATVANISSGLEWLKRVCSANDTVVIFISGHGLKGRRGLYYVPYEGDSDALQYSCVNWEDVAGTIKNVDAKQIFFITDVCHAGDFAISKVPRQDELAESIKTIENVLLFASSGPDEVSLESSDWGHGAFTKAFLDALAGDADANGDQKITLDELVASTIKTTKRLTGNRQTPCLPATGGYLGATVIGHAKEQSR